MNVERLISVNPMSIYSPSTGRAHTEDLTHAKHLFCYCVTPDISSTEQGISSQHSLSDYVQTK